MNFFSLSKFAARFQIVATAAKLVSCGVIIMTGLYFYAVKGMSIRNNQKLFKAGPQILKTQCKAQTIV